MKKSLFIVRTPFQLFNSIEAQRRFENFGESYLLCIYKKDIDRKMMEKMLPMGKWKQVKWFKLTFFNRTFYPFILNGFLGNLQKAEYCFFGLVTKLITHCINVVGANQNILIDDGNEIFMIAQKISTPFVFEIPWYKKIFHALMGRRIDYKYLEKTKIFTFFDLSSYRLTNNAIKNDYKFFKSGVTALPQAEEVFFIGSNLVNTYIEPKIFEENLKKIVAYYFPLKLVYCLHRYEDRKYLEELAEKFNFKVITFPVILEMALLEYGKKPQRLATFRSSALETLRCLYAPLKVEVFCLDVNHLLKPHQKQEFEDLYSNFQQQNISMIRLENK